MLDTILFAAITAFIKERLGLSGYWAVLVAVLVGSIFWFQSYIVAFSPVLASAIDYLKFILAAPGVFDLAVNVGSKIKKVSAK